MSLSSVRGSKFILFAFLIMAICSFTGYEKNEPVKQVCDAGVLAPGDSMILPHSNLYAVLHLGAAGLTKEAFDYALKGFTALAVSGKLRNDRILSIVDFSLNSCKKRLFIIDLQSGRLLFNTFVAHGRNSGREVASSFSNAAESFKSSLGFYVTAETYSGNHGYSLRLEGEESGINDNALSRGIVMHSANYVSESVARAQGFIGRSLGCPAVPEALHKSIIEKIKNGTCLFLYSPDKFYITHSRLLRQG